MHNKDIKSWGSAVSLEKREQFEERAETILQLLKSRLSGALSEALALGVNTTRIEDVFYAYQLAQDPSKKNSRRKLSLSDSDRISLKNFDPKQETERLNCMEPLASFTLSDYMGWALDEDSERAKTEQVSPKEISASKESNLKKSPITATHKKFSYIRSLSIWEA